VKILASYVLLGLLVACSTPPESIGVNQVLPVTVAVADLPVSRSGSVHGGNGHGHGHGHGHGTLVNTYAPREPAGPSPREPGNDGPEGGLARFDGTTWRPVSGAPAPLAIVAGRTGEDVWVSGAGGLFRIELTGPAR